MILYFLSVFQKVAETFYDIVDNNVNTKHDF